MWDRVAQCESGGDWSINTGNGYYGGVQFLPSTWRAYGGTGMPHQASRAEQIAVAQRTLAAQGPGAWPTCSRKAGLTRANGGATSAAAEAPAKTAPQAKAKKAAVATPAPRKATKGKASTATPRQARGVATVRAGDTLGRIAARERVPGGWEALYHANRNRVANPNLIYPGQELKL